MSNKSILSAAVEANEAELPVALGVNNGVFDTATDEGSQEQQESLEKLTDASVRGQIINNSFSAEDIMKFRPRKPIQQVKNYNVGRNDKCPCGSGKKYKHCCLNSKTYEGYHNAGEAIA